MTREAPQPKNTVLHTKCVQLTQEQRSALTGRVRFFFMDVGAVVLSQQTLTPTR